MCLHLVIRRIEANNLLTSPFNTDRTKIKFLLDQRLCYDRANKSLTNQGFVKLLSLMSRFINVNLLVRVLEEDVKCLSGYLMWDVRLGVLESVRITRSNVWQDIPFKNVRSKLLTCLLFLFEALTNQRFVIDFVWVLDVRVKTVWGYWCEIYY